VRRSLYPCGQGSCDRVVDDCGHPREDAIVIQRDGGEREVTHLRLVVKGTKRALVRMVKEADSLDDFDLLEKQVAYLKLLLKKEADEK
jgi:hypothetical protein